MAAVVSQPLPPRNIPILTLVVVTAVLYFAQVVLIPLALAVLLSFLLAPAVRRLERWGLPRALATVIVVLMSFSVIGTTAWVAGREALQLATSLPQYKDNIRSKLEALRGSPGGALGKASEALKDLKSELEENVGEEPSDGSGAGRPLAVQIEPPGVTPLQIVRDLAGPLFAPLGIAGAVIVFTILMLLKREDMRDRVIRLMGRGQMNVTTQALGEAAERVTRYLAAQLVVNACYGIPVGIALYLLGIPNAALWGLLAILLRFIPYVGAWIAAAMPVMLAFAIGDGWSLVLWTIAVFLALELVSNNFIEPWLYGASTGLSTLAVMVAAIFWTWLWGIVGLLLATPLTVCLAVMGRYIPQLRFLDILLGDAPGLSPAARFYQRLLAFDHEEATELAEEHAARESLLDLFDRVLIPALVLAEEDRHSDEMDERRQRFIHDSTRRLIEDLTETNEKSSAPGADRTQLAIVSARDEADDLAGLMLERLLEPTLFRPLLLAHDLSSPEVLDRAVRHGASVVLISAVPPYAVMHTVYIARRLRRRLPQAHIVAGIWGSPVTTKARERLADVGVSRIVASMQEAVAALQHVAAPIGTAMLAPRRPADEAGRLRALADLRLLDTPPEDSFDRITKELARIFDVPMALMTLVDSERQWWKSQIGLPADLAAQRGTPRDVSLCGHVVGNQEMLVVDDLARDERFANNPLVRARGLRFYAGAPLRTESGHVMGSLCIIDTRPRHLEPRERQMLQLVADLAMTEVQRRKERLVAQPAAVPSAAATPRS